MSDNDQKDTSLDTENTKTDQTAESKTQAKPSELKLPKVDFSTFILSMASSTLVQLGEVPHPENGQVEENLALAKHSIDLIEMLSDKTTNGLNEDEKRLLDGILYELRMKYVLKSS